VHSETESQHNLAHEAKKHKIKKTKAGMLCKNDNSESLWSQLSTDSKRWERFLKKVGFKPEMKKVTDGNRGKMVEEDE